MSRYLLYDLLIAQPCDIVTIQPFSLALGKCDIFTYIAITSSPLGQLDINITMPLFYHSNMDSFSFSFPHYNLQTRYHDNQLTTSFTIVTGYLRDVGLRTNWKPLILGRHLHYMRQGIWCCVGATWVKNPGCRSSKEATTATTPLFAGNTALSHILTRLEASY